MIKLTELFNQCQDHLVKILQEIVEFNDPLIGYMKFNKPLIRSGSIEKNVNADDRS